MECYGGKRCAGRAHAPYAGQVEQCQHHDLCATMEGVLPFLTEDDVRRHLRYEELIVLMSEALAAYSRTSRNAARKTRPRGAAAPSSTSSPADAIFVQQPLRSVLSIAPDGGVPAPSWFSVMPVIYGEVMGAKLVTVFPGNHAEAQPTHQAIIQLFDSTSGAPLATMDGRLITEMRTAAVSAVASSLLCQDGFVSLAILGSGVQAQAHLDALSYVRRFDSIRVWSRTPAHAQQFAERNGIEAVATAEEAVRDADLIVTATHSSTPILRGKWLKPGAHVNAVGAVGMAARELDNAAMKNIIIVDSRESALHESAEVVHAGAAIHSELGDLIAKPNEKLRGKTTIFKSLGIAVEDIAAAAAVLKHYPSQVPAPIADAPRRAAAKRRSR